MIERRVENKTAACGQQPHLNKAEARAGAQDRLIHNFHLHGEAVMPRTMPMPVKYPTPPPRLRWQHVLPWSRTHVTVVALEIIIIVFATVMIIVQL